MYIFILQSRETGLYLRIVDNSPLWVVSRESAESFGRYYASTLAAQFNCLVFER